MGCFGEEVGPEGLVYGPVKGGNDVGLALGQEQQPVYVVWAGLVCVVLLAQSRDWEPSLEQAVGPWVGLGKELENCLSP